MDQTKVTSYQDSRSEVSNEAENLQRTNGQISHIPKAERPLIVAQYEQLHEMRREYNRFIFQAPTIVVAVVGAFLAVVGQSSQGGSFNLTLNRLAAFAELLLVLSGFILVIGYWALRSQTLLRRSELALRQMEEENGDTDVAMYPAQINRTLPRWKTGPSTLMIVWYIFVLGVGSLILGIIGLIIRK